MSTKSEKKASAKHHHRGTLLTILLVIMVLHGLAATYFYYTARMDTSIITRPWLITLMVIHSFANVVAAVGIWNWKMWGWKLFVASTVLGLVVGLLSIGIWATFSMVLPLAIVGWALRTKWDYFS